MKGALNLIEYSAIKLEGQSEAEVHTSQTVTGKDEGPSILYYKNVAGLDISGFITEDDAQAIP